MQSTPSSTDRLPSVSGNPWRAALTYFVDWFRWTARPKSAKALVELQGLLVFAFGFGFHAYLAPYGIDPHHDGIMFKPALDVSQGLMVFRDSFTQYGGVTVLLQAAALKLFGPYLLVIRLQTALFYGIGFYLFWRVWKRLMPSILATTICLIGTVLGPDSIALSLPWSSVHALVFQGITLLCAVRYFETGKERELFMAGAAAALAFWCRQPVGAFLGAGLGVAVVLIGWRMAPAYANPPSAFSLRARLGQTAWARLLGTALLFGGGFVAVNLTIFAWLATYHALLDWWKQSILFAVVFAKARATGDPFEPILACLFPAGHLRIWALLGTGVAIQTMRTISPFLDPKHAPSGSSGATALLASVVAITSWLQYFPVACNYHCYWAGIPMLGVLVHLLYSTHSSASRISRSALTLAAIGILFYYDASYRIDAVKPHIDWQNVPVTSIVTFRGMRVNAAEAANYDAMQSLIDQYRAVHPDGTIVNTTGNALFPTFMVHQESYHPMHVLWEQMEPLYPDMNQKRNDYVRDKLPLVFGPGEVPPTHVYVGHITFSGIGYNVLFPKDVNPTEILECDGGGTCHRRPIT
jgi:hypothetical protein